MDFETTCDLINKVKQHNCLWAKSSKDYRNVLKKEKIWVEIAAELKKSVDSIKNRWKSLRDRFVREQGQITVASSSGSAAPDSPSWQYFNELSFLKAHCQKRPTMSNYQSSSQNSADPATSFSEADPNGENEQQQQEVQQIEPETPTIRKRNAMDARFHNMLDKVESLCTPAKTSRHDSFARYLCDRLEILPLSMARSLELEILNHVHKTINDVENVEYLDPE
ncbi:transcription factor Adf-1-like [Armigeres subalbatus]|uniref:transcription factor Adf-1-like n=1 Tax=Armigeres subalbatus TaxID=124917 RepID=UPI002ED2C44F